MKKGDRKDDAGKEEYNDKRTRITKKGQQIHRSDNKI